MESILNVDDYAPGRYARTRVLRQAGYTVWEAATGEETFQQAAEHNPELILLDVNLPDTNGTEVCRRLRQNLKTAGSIIVHISSSSVQAHQQVAGLDAGADGYLVEPIDASVLIASVRAFLRARQAEIALRRSNEELEWFAHRVAHDLSEPLRTIIAHTQALERKMNTSELEKTYSEGLSFVVNAAQRMNVFMNGLLRFAEAAHRPGEAQRQEKVNCEAVLRQTIANLDASIQASGAKITHDPLPVLSSAVSIDEVFQNLIGNAIKYRREGASPEVHVSALRDGGNWLFSVRDNGMGIDPQYCQDIFKIFHRLNAQDVSGSGIGLALVKKIVEMQGGSIWVESQPGEGSTFYFTIPA